MWSGCLHGCVCRFLWRSLCLQDDRGVPCVKSISPMLLAHTPLFEPALRFLNASVCSSAQLSASYSFPGSFTASLYFSFSGARFCPSFLVSLLFFFFIFLLVSFLLSFFLWAETHRHGNWAAAAPGCYSSLAVSGGNRRSLDWIAPVCVFLLLQAFVSFHHF